MSLWQRARTGPGVLVIGGLLLWGMAWYIDLATHIEKYGVGTGAHVHGGDGLIRVNFPMSGMPLLFFGMMMFIGTETLLKRGGLLLLAASLLLMVDGLAHAFAFNDHLGQLSSAAFFAFIAPAEIAVGVALPFIVGKYDLHIVAGMAGLLVLYVVSRTVSVAAMGWPEPVEALDVFSKVVEVLVIVTIVWHGRAVAPRTRTAARAEAKPGEAASAES